MNVTTPNVDTIICGDCLLTEEQRPTAGFDLEKARDVEKAMSPMPWIVLEEAHGEMIIIRNPNHPMYIDGIVAWGKVAEANTPDAIGIAYMRENFSNLIGEIERLRASLIDLHAEYINTLEKNPDCSAWDLDEQSDADQRRLRKNAMKAISISEPPIYLQAEQQATKIRELKADLEQAERVIEARLEVIDQQAAKIRELEDALVEERARGNHYGMSYEDAVGDGEFERWIIDGEKDLPKIYIDRVRAEATRQLRADGKIGPDAKPRSWQITEDRVTAIDQGLRFLEWSNAINGSVETKKHIATLQTMLEEASDEHGFER